MLVTWINENKIPFAHSQLPCLQKDEAPTKASLQYVKQEALWGWTGAGCSRIGIRTPLFISLRHVVLSESQDLSSGLPGRRGAGLLLDNQSQDKRG